MELETQVCSLELAKRLQQLEVRRHSYFLYIINELEFVKLIRAKSTDFYLVDDDGFKYALSWYMQNEWKFYKAYTASELLDIIPTKIQTKDEEPFNDYRLQMQMGILSTDGKTFAKNYIFNYEPTTFEARDDGTLKSNYTFMEKSIYDESLSNAAAKLLIYLLENGHHKIKHS